MTAKHKPATSLPWRVSKANDGGFRVVQAVAPIAQITKIGKEQNAAYIAHACTAYPKLVEALREFVDAGMDPDESARALLRELGEAE